MAKSKVISSGSPAFAKGGKGKMFGKQSAGPQKAGVVGHTTAGKGGKFAKGGKGKMFGKQSAVPAKPGVSR